MIYPVGFCFQPTDLELVLYYLERRMSPDLVPISDGLVVDFDIYQCDPWNLPRDRFKFPSDQPEMFFFSPRHHPTSKNNKTTTKRKTNANANANANAAVRFHRTAGSGFWHGYGRDNLIHAHINGRRVVVGHKTSFQFKLFLNVNDQGIKKKKNDQVKTNWIMHEYRHHKFDDLVLCKIYEKKTSTNAKVEDDWLAQDDGLQEEEEGEEPQIHRLKRRRVEEPHSLLLPIVCPPPAPAPAPAPAPVDDVTCCNTFEQESKSEEPESTMATTHLQASSQSSSSSSMPPLVSWEGEGVLIAPSTLEVAPLSQESASFSRAETPYDPPQDGLDDPLYPDFDFDGLPSLDHLPLPDELLNFHLPPLDADNFNTLSPLCREHEELASFFLADDDSYALN